MAGKVALITGITGQDGSYLTELLLEKNYIVHGVVRPGSGLKNIEHLGRDDKISGRRVFTHESDITDGATLRRILRDVQPAELYHLAGQSHIGRSFEISESTYEQTGNATLQLLEIARAQSPRIRFFHASSAEIFGNAREVPQTESTPLEPITPYGRAKAFGTEQARAYRNTHGLFVCNGILYNHESPRRGESFVTRKIARGAARIARGLDQELLLGNLGSRRDWGRAQEYVRAMWLMLQHETPGDYILATGEIHSVAEFVEAAFAVVDLPWQKFVRHDPSLKRSTDLQLVGCGDKIYRTLGWKPTGTFDQLVREMVEAELVAIDAKSNSKP